VNKKIWFDITNTPQVHFLLGIHNSLKNNNYDFEFTCREFAETSHLLSQKINKPFYKIGKHYGKSKIKKVLGTFDRFGKFFNIKIDFDISISCGSEIAVFASKIRNKKSIAFGDNDKARQWTYGYFVDYAFFPNAISKDILINQGIGEKKLYQYNGYKEDIYIADYVPNHSFVDELPFANYVLLRPENLQANYVTKGAKTIVPELLKMLSEKGINILYIPRYDVDHQYAKGINNIYIPEDPINGLDACYYADCVLTGAGTFAREAACLGVPAVSFYAGKELLAVDKKMIKDGWTFFSRNPDDIFQYVLKAKRRESDLSRSKRVKKEVIDKLISVIQDLIV
jgi:uncharacterized protein